jgi:dethiobiotin synthetase
MSYIIAGIHTGIGKTMCSAILCEALGYDYWKPVQAGDLDNSDSIFIKNHVANPLCTIHAETYCLKMAASPHIAADTEGVLIEKEKFVLPKSANKIIVETAGGIMSPLAKGFLNLDLIKHLGLPVVLVSENYLGSINHTLLTVKLLQNENIPIKGLVFNGETVKSSVDFILEHTGLPLLFSIPRFQTVENKRILDLFDLDNLRNLALKFQSKIHNL